MKIERQLYHDQYGQLTARKVIVLPDGRRAMPSRKIGFIWAQKTWSDGADRYSRGDMVFEWGGVAYRMGEKSASPLRLQAGERLEPMDFGGTGCFV